MKKFSKVLLVLYLMALLWLVLFKFSFDIPSVLIHYQTRSLNLIPFAGSHLGEMLANFVVFVPFGLLLSINFKQPTIWRKLTYIFIFSVGVEITQFVFAIGATDITDVIMNTSGGLAGLLLYGSTGKVDSSKRDRLITAICAGLIFIIILLRLFVFRVRY
ncbi:MAG TPA: VanZ family protein [Candidatus Chromulinivoraceae bacterium]|nr:VanZ family protein [Candidatus Chromulinivoraceae bacterium]